ncbi:GntR family transcriptional regulator [Calderihabitans maritimus]|uniref:TrkA-C domain-containing protein n=1 Tax=Calderihabitans maritimus TaxID=1246530 RepID=A0A1Z5HS49_9FIRM|nr:GntR family transcriptional regulator [Calderihabitans maritimus]GAW92349.1 TrkA-C domain-containing protein [Calderihabitans maritimus]
MNSPQKGLELPRYETIAWDIARRIVQEEYREGVKLLGRSLLAAQYKVSPETIRKATALLQLHDVVQVIPGTGIVVKSRTAAEQFLTIAGNRQEFYELRDRINFLLEERRKIEKELEKCWQKLLRYLDPYHS